MKIKKKLYIPLRIFMFSIISLILFLSNGTAFAISQNDRENLHTPWHDDCAPEAGQEASAVSTDIGKVFMVGDSITYAASLSPHNMKGAFSRKGIDAVISGTGAGSITSVPSNATGDKLTALEAIDEYEKKGVDDADAIIVAHGTNHYPDNAFKSAIRQMVTKIESVNESAAIFWVNTYTKASGASSTNASKKKNQIIRNLSSELGYDVINVTNVGIKLAPDNIHPDYNEAGIGKWRDAVVADVADGASAPSDRPASDSSSVSEICCPGGESAPGDSSLTGADGEEKTWNYFKGRGLPDEAVAGIMGNIAEESAFNPRNAQVGDDTDDPSKFTTSGNAWGLIQWDPGNKILDAHKEAKKHKRSLGLTYIDGEIHELGTQLDLLWGHMHNKPPITKGSFSVAEFKKIDNEKDAASYFENKIEGAGIPRMDDRWASAEAALKKYGGSGGGGGSLGGGGGGNCACEGPAVSGKVVVLDPGHSGIDKQGQEKDSATGIYIGDSSNPGERVQMWEVSEKIKEKLESEGFQVIVTKNKEDSYVNLKKRAAIANKAEAAIAVSLHNTPGTFGDKASGWVTPQKVGGYRTGDRKVEFKDKTVADKSLAYSEIILEERKKTEGDAQMHDISFDGRAGLSPGNLSAVQLFSKVPWVYNEVGQSGFNGEKYTEGIANGIIKALGSGGAEGECGGAVSGDVQGTVKNYAWPDYSSTRSDPKPAYKKAFDAAAKEGQYPGGGYTDCGAFVTRVMIDSGFEPKYNHSGDLSKGAGPTGTQEVWLKDNWQRINPSSTKDLKPGDVGVNSGHTFLYVGEVSGFNDVFASASLSRTKPRVPMAGQGDALGGSYNFYRKR